MYVNSLFNSIFFIQYFNLFVFYFHFIPFHLSSSVRYDDIILMCFYLTNIYLQFIEYQLTIVLRNIKRLQRILESMETGWHGMVSRAAVVFDDCSYIGNVMDTTFTSISFHPLANTFLSYKMKGLEEIPTLIGIAIFPISCESWISYYSDVRWNDRIRMALVETGDGVLSISKNVEWNDILRNNYTNPWNNSHGSINIYSFYVRENNHINRW